MRSASAQDSASSITTSSGNGWPAIEIDSKELIDAGSDFIKDTAKRLLENGQNR